MRLGASETNVIEQGSDALREAATLTSLSAFTIRWSIGSRGEESALGGAAVLEWRIDGDEAEAMLRRVEAGTVSESIVRARVTRRVHDTSAGLDHVEVDGLLWVTLARSHGGERRLLFARTVLLWRLGVGGGQSAPPRLA